MSWDNYDGAITPGTTAQLFFFGTRSEKKNLCPTYHIMFEYGGTSVKRSVDAKRSSPLESLRPTWLLLASFGYFWPNLGPFFGHFWQLFVH